MSTVPENLVPPDNTLPIVLGIDPGTQNLGWGALVLGGPQPRFLACGVVRPPRGTIGERLGHIQASLEELLSRLRPSSLVIEGAFTARNQRSALRLGEARGVVLAGAARRGVQIHELAPSAAKKAVTGYGMASKEQVARTIAGLLRIDPEGVANDATDALALAWAAAQRSFFATRLSRKA